MWFLFFFSLGNPFRVASHLLWVIFLIERRQTHRAAMCSRLNVWSCGAHCEKGGGRNLLVMVGRLERRRIDIDTKTCTQELDRLITLSDEDSPSFNALLQKDDRVLNVLQIYHENSRVCVCIYIKIRPEHSDALQPLVKHIRHRCCRTQKARFGLK